MEGNRVGGLRWAVCWLLNLGLLKTFCRSFFNALFGITFNDPFSDSRSTSTSTTGNRRTPAFKVNMLCWSLEDTYVITSSSDYHLRVWDPSTGTLIHLLRGHTNDSYVLWAHPIHRELVASGSHDGTLVVWDVEKGERVGVWRNETTDTHSHIPIFDLTWASDGSRLVFVDQDGQLTVMGVGEGGMATTQPREQFFNTDYHPLVYDENGYALDDNTELAPEV